MWSRPSIGRGWGGLPALEATRFPHATITGGALPCSLGFPLQAASHHEQHSRRFPGPRGVFHALLCCGALALAVPMRDGGIFSQNTYTALATLPPQGGRF
jgi:hypothetical protein